MLRDGRPADVEMGRDVSGGAFGIPHEAEDLSPPRLCDGLQGGLHVRM
jgi:hypothetical protein